MKKILVIASIAMLWASGAWALGTTAGTSIANYATLSYTAGGVSQPDKNSTTDTFVVDKKIDMLLVTTDTDQQPGALGQQHVITHFQFKNEGNADQNFTFTITNLATGSGIANQADYDADADSNDVSNLEVSCDNGAHWYASGALTMEFAATDPATVVDCQVRANIPASGSAVDGDIMNIELVATAVKADGSNETNTTGTDNQTSVDVVLADGYSGNDPQNTLGDKTGPGNGAKGDHNQDGKEVARSGYIVKTPVLSATKTSCVVSDPVNGTTEPKRIPGAVIRYMFDIKNTGSAAVSDLNVTDTFSTNFTDGTNIQISNVKKDENKTSCSCTNPGNTDATHSESGMTTTIQGISVAAPSGGNESHSCVSVEVEIK